MVKDNNEKFSIADKRAFLEHKLSCFMTEQAHTDVEIDKLKKQLADIADGKDMDNECKILDKWKPIRNGAILCTDFGGKKRR